MFKKILRGLIDERDPELKEIFTKKYFTEDSMIKTFKLFEKYNLSNGGEFGGLPHIETFELYLERLGFEVPTTIKLDKYNISPLIDYLLSQNLLKTLHTIELFTTCLFEIISERRLNFQIFMNFINDLNNFYDKNSIPFKLEFNQSLMKTIILKKESEFEEFNKEKVLELIKDKKYDSVNEYFTTALKNYTESDYKPSIENSYLALEKLLKIFINNHKKDANSSYSDFQKKFEKNFKGIFSIRKKEIKNKISFVESIRSEIKAHSPKEHFNTNEFLEETSRFQINEVMNLIILLFNIIKK